MIDGEIDKNMLVSEYLEVSKAKQGKISIQTKDKELVIEQESLETLRKSIEKQKEDDHENLIEILEKLKENGINNRHVGPLAYYIYNLKHTLYKHRHPTLTIG